MGQQGNGVPRATRVAIIGAGPAGLLLGQLLTVAGPAPMIATRVARGMPLPC